MLFMLSSAALSQNRWWTQTSGVNSSLQSVYFVNNNTGWAVGQYYTILKTTNAGVDWLIQQQLISTEYYGLNSVYFIDENTGWTAGSGRIQKTTNGGINWIGQSGPSGFWYFSVYFSDADFGWIAGGEGVILSTTNGGANWIRQSSGTDAWLASVHFKSRDKGWVAGKDEILNTTNGGANWTGQIIGGFITELMSVFFIDVNTGWIVGHDYFQTYYKALKTTNGGTNWINQQGISYNDLNSVYFINDSIGWIAGYREILKTTNGGINWVKQLDNPNKNLKSIFAIGSDSVWAVGDSGKIVTSIRLQYHNDVGLTSIFAPARDSVIYTDCSGTGGILPKFNVKNFGTNNQNSFFDVHCQIKLGNNIVYSSTKQDTIDSGQIHTVEFDYFSFLQSVDFENSNYKVKAWTSLPSDNDFYNDTVESKFTVSNPNYGYTEEGGYYFLNSSDGANCIPDQPVYSWEDTTGSTSLIVDGQPVIPYTEYNGIDFCGSIRLPDVLPDGRKFKFFGTCYDTVIIANNGIIGFGNASLDRMNTPSNVAIPSVNAPHPAIFPFWYRVNFLDPEITGRNLKYKLTDDKFIITYDRVPLYNAIMDNNDYVTYQVILQTGLDCGSENGKIKVQFNYDNCGSTFLNNYYNGNLNAMTVGIQNAAGDIAIQYRRSEANHIVTVPGPLFGSPLAIDFAPINSVLPVELESFTSSVYENNVSLQWRVTLEINNSGFDIERSNIINDVSGDWMKIGNIAGKRTTATAQQYSFADKDLSSGKYKYRLKQIDFNGSCKYYDLQNEVVIGVPVKFNLSQNYPNPFNPATKIKFEIPVDSKVILKIYDNTGRELKTLMNEYKTAGYYAIDFSANNLSSGVYFYRMTAGEFTAAKKLVVLK